MILDKSNWSAMFACTARLMKENKTLLSEIDSKFGDGDHGVTIAKIADIFEIAIEAWKNNDWTLKEFFATVGDRVINVSGGSAGPLYGTFLAGLGETLGAEKTADAQLLKRILRSGLDELQGLTNAKVGDKTMMDTLIPAIEAATDGPDDIVEILRLAKDAALAGAAASEGFVSKFGRAKSYKEATIGTPDAGAVSCTYIFLGFYAAVLS
jgi:dihydroxyacetone kinase-like protein